ncbi:MAG: branched-chain amino acid ABC transporter permease [Acidimicrobiia bacterium]|nr:branched-chain amino acid ABC transporter permease [Acidimicrobiia bacterium]
MPGFVLQAAIEGLVAGGIYALLGLGFHLMFGVLKRVNLAYGTTLMASVYLAALSVNLHGVPWPAALPLALIIGIAITLAVERLVFAWVRGDGRFSMVATLGIWMIIEEFLIRTPGHGRGQAIVNPFDLALVSVGRLELRVDHIFAFVLSLALCAGIHAFLFHSRAGLKIRVVVEDRALAGLLGIDAASVTRWTFALAAVIGVIAGYVFATAQHAIDVHIGMWATLKGLVILVLGGAGNLWGVVAAALGLGIMERVGTELAGPGYRDLIGYGLMLCLLALFPHGFGWRARLASG